MYADWPLVSYVYKPQVKGSEEVDTPVDFNPVRSAYGGLGASRDVLEDACIVDQDMKFACVLPVLSCEFGDAARIGQIHAPHRYPGL